MSDFHIRKEIFHISLIMVSRIKMETMKMDLL